MRWFAPVVVLCLLLAGASTTRADRKVDRPCEQIVAVKALAKIAVRRHDVGRGSVAKLDLDPVTPLAIDDTGATPAQGVAVEHDLLQVFVIERQRTFDARGPPVG